MLTIEEYKRKFPEGFSYGSFSGVRLQPGASLLAEGYLLFTPETAFRWAGPFEGGYAIFTLKDFTNAVVSSGPEKGKSYLEYVARRSAKHREDSRRRAIFLGNPIQDPKPGTLTEAMGYESLEYPVRLWMAGNDDTSYSKCYRTEQEAQDELSLFIGNEPLDFTEVIRGFRFIFTN